jgi:hypothetical protein
MDCKKIILTTDQHLIKDGVQAIDDEFLKWFIQNPSCESIETLKFADSRTTYIYKIIIPQDEAKAHSFCETPEEKCTMNYCDENGCMNRKREATEDSILIKTPKQETLEEVAERYSKRSSAEVFQEAHKRDFIAGAKWQQEQIPSIIEQYLETAFISKEQGYKNPKDWFEQFKKKEIID